MFGDGLTRNFQRRAPGLLTVLGVQDFDPGAADYRSLASTVAQMGVDCVLISASGQDHAAKLTEDVAVALPTVKIFGSDGLAQGGYADPAQGGIPVALDSRVLITAATVRPSEPTPAGDAFLKRYTSRYGDPAPYAIDGYEAMSLMLDAIRRATRNGRVTADRSRVLAALYATKRRVGALGTYNIDGAGETTLRDYGVYGIVGGRLTFEKTAVGPAPGKR
jgi:branched-chain amino acid transport system substrate-binding protein